MSRFTEFKLTPFGRLIGLIIRTADRTLNLIINGDFSHTLSAYYGLHDPACRLCRIMAKLEKWHCIRAAKNEGLISAEQAFKLSNGEV